MLTVTVSGLAGEGKSTVAAIVAQCLSEHGFTIVTSDKDNLIVEQLPERISELVKRNTTINVNIVQLHRQSSAFLNIS